MIQKRKLTTKQKVGILLGNVVGIVIGSGMGYLLTHEFSVAPYICGAVGATVAVLGTNALLGTKEKTDKAGK